jgi:hypothetical protein
MPEALRLPERWSLTKVKRGVRGEAQVHRRHICVAGRHTALLVKFDDATLDD